MDKGEGGFGEGTYKMEHFHPNEAISIVADEGFLGEEDDDYEDLYNDVNVGEGFLQSLRKGEELEFRNEEEEKGESSPKIAPEQRGVSVTDVGEGPEGGGEASMSGIQNNQAFRGNGVKGTIGPGSGGIRVELGQRGVMGKMSEVEEQSRNTTSLGVQGIVGGQQLQGDDVGNVRSVGNEGLVRQGGEGGGNVNGMDGNGVGNTRGVNGVDGGGSTVSGGGGGGGGGTILFVGDLHWWTTDAELKAELCKYGPLKELKFFDKKASGKSKGYCQVEFYDPAVATACKEGMNGHVSMAGRVLLHLHRLIVLREWRRLS